MAANPTVAALNSGASLLLLATGAGCGLGSVGVGALSDSGSDSNDPPRIGTVAVTNTELSPASVEFTLIDPENDATSVELEYRVLPAPTFTSLALTGDTNLTALAASPGGTPHTRMWAFDGQVGTALSDEIEVRVRIAGQAENEVAGGVRVGNDAPEVLAVELLNVVDALCQVDAGCATGFPDPTTTCEVEGFTNFEFGVVDSSAHFVNIRVEFNATPGFPPDQWQLATPGTTSPNDPLLEVECAGCTAAPECDDPGAVCLLPLTCCLEECYQFVCQATVPADPGAPACEGGADVFFSWHVEKDLADLEAEVRVRFTPDDGFTAEADLVSFETPTFRVDNDDMPPGPGGGGDSGEGSGELSIPFIALDAEHNVVGFIVQWSPARR